MLNGKNVDLSGVSVAPYEENGNVMLPLRKVAEAMGYTASWIPEENCARIENEKYILNIFISSDNYSLKSNGFIRYCGWCRKSGGFSL